MAAEVKSQPILLYKMQQQHYMHLTNYSINKHSDGFDASEAHDKGTKRTLKYFNGWLAQNGYSVSELWARIHVSGIVYSMTFTQNHQSKIHQFLRSTPRYSITSLQLCRMW